jgi:hypothetical protein
MRKLKLHKRVGRDDKEVIEEYALVDDEDYDKVKDFKWYLKVDNANDPARKHLSVGRKAVKESSTHRPDSLVLLGRFILGIDHPAIVLRYKNGNTLDNRKENLLLYLNGHSWNVLREHVFSNMRIRYEFPR